MSYLDVTQQAGARFFGGNTSGPVVMLNLLRFRDTAVFPAGKEPPIPMSGREAYQKYTEATKPFLEAVGSEVIFSGQADHFLIGPEEEVWDLALLVRHPSKEVFLQFAQNEGYLKTLSYRTAALADSRLLPIVPGTES
ncbi:DUF1330 domain-containing protein [Neolewinella aurantiaca]|uniref:DUF1330 domain-containing protein n=1 Tax=Neolewinella aurantiaca TaxID=2602767 RepID=A0A5C7G1F9_9BACT|nr:DUF1330 domain-containing protein [Neolewinella aurantiaca]TXF91722.1 DUF1330 domain-containing protein [Neolewinella aurantiaca]